MIADFIHPVGQSNKKEDIVSISNPEFSQSSVMRPVALSDHGGHAHASTTALVLAAIGIVFGDIGTSPLYSLKECFSPALPPLFQNRPRPKQIQDLAIYNFAMFDLSYIHYPPCV